MNISLIQDHQSFYKNFQGIRNQFAVNNLTIIKSIESLFVALRSRDEQTAIHSLLVAEYCFLLASIHDPKHALLYYYGGLCHDLGKFAMPDQLLKGSHRLNEIEREGLKEHVSEGVNILTQLKMPPKVIEIAKYHHERFNGSGYLEGLNGNDIPLSGRISAIADVYSALAIPRPYQPSLKSHSDILGILHEEKEKYDPEILTTFTRIVRPLDTSFFQNINLSFE